MNRYEDADDEALIEVTNAWVDTAGEGGKTLLEETRAMRFRPRRAAAVAAGLDVVLAAPKEPVTLGKTQLSA